MFKKRGQFLDARLLVFRPQHLDSLKNCCEKGAVLRKGGNCPEKWEIFASVFLLVYYFLIFDKTFLLKKPKMPRKVTLQIKNEGLELLKKHD